MSDTIHMVGPDTQQVYSVPMASEKAYADAGYTRYNGLALDEGTLAQRIQAWRGQVADTLQDYGAGAANAFPLANTLVDKFADADTRQAYFQNIAEGEQRSPVAFKIGSAVGTLGGFVGGEAALGAGLKGLGALGEAGAAASGAIESAAAAHPYVAAAARSAAVSGSSDAAQQFDEAATRHALQPEGTEKLGFSYARLGADTALGGVFGAAGEGIARIGGAADAVKAAGNKLMASNILSKEAKANLAQQGKGDVLKYVEDLAGATPSKAGFIRRLGGDIDAASKDIKGVAFLAKGQRMSIEEAEDMAASMRGAIRSEDNPAHLVLEKYERRIQQARALVADGDPANAQALMPSLRDLTQDYNKLYREAHWDDLAAHPHNAEYRQAGEAMSQSANQMVGRVLGPDQQKKLAAAKSLYSKTVEVRRLMNKADAGTLGDLVRKSAAGAALGGLLAGPAGAAKAAGAAGAGGLFVGALAASPYLAGQGVRGIGKIMAKADNKIVQSLAQGLNTTGRVVTTDLIDGNDYQDLRARVEAANRDPLKSTAAHHESLTDAGVPEAAADKLALQGRATMAAAGEAAPKRQGPADMVTLAQPDPIAARKWVAYVRSAQDPTYALRNPTAANMDAASRFFPQTIQNAQNGLHEQVAKNPELGLEGKMYAAKVLRRSVSPITSPTFFQTLRQQRAAAEAQAQGAGPTGPQRSAGGANRLQSSEQTRLGELSGG